MVTANETTAQPENALNLTDLEHKFLKIMCCTDFSFEYEGAGIRGYADEDLFSSDDMVIYRGVMSSLVKKKIIEVDIVPVSRNHKMTWVCCVDNDVNAHFYNLIFGGVE